jgi:hypothetical protein
VNSQHVSRPRLVPINAVQHPLDKALLKFPYSLVEQDPAFHHPADKPFHLILHVATLQKENDIVPDLT